MIKFDQPQTDSEMQQYYIVPIHEGPTNDGHDANDEGLEMRYHNANQNDATDGDQQFGENTDDFVTPSDYRVTVTLL